MNNGVSAFVISAFLAMSIFAAMTMAVLSPRSPSAAPNPAS